MGKGMKYIFLILFALEEAIFFTISKEYLHWPWWTIVIHGAINGFMFGWIWLNLIKADKEK